MDPYNPSRRPAGLLLLAFVLPSVPTALHGQLPSEPTRELEAEVVATEVSGLVQLPDGTEVPNAVVVTSLGGEALTDADGRFKLGVDVPLDVAAFHVTAAANLLGANHSGTLIVQPTSPGFALDTGALVIEATASCQPSWLPTFGDKPGMDNWVACFAVFDDGSGPALYAGGAFKFAGGASANRFARWDGTSWSSLGAGLMSGVIRALAVYDDGTGQALYAGGDFHSIDGIAANYVARWDGASWSALGIGTPWEVNALRVFDDGGGLALHVAGGTPDGGGVARWDGTSWSVLGGAAGGANGAARDLAVFDDGSGPALYAGGSFTKIGGLVIENVAKWNGSVWAPVGPGLNGSVLALAVFDDGGGEALYAGGYFGQGIAKWNGHHWSSLAGGISGPSFPRVEAIVAFDDGAGPALYVGGDFMSAGGVPVKHVARWNGSDWSPLGSGTNNDVLALGVFEDGGGVSKLCVGGLFVHAGDLPAYDVAAWDGTSWSQLGSGLSGLVRALAVFDDGGGPALYVGGDFITVAGEKVNNVAKWDGAGWSPLGEGFRTSIYAFATFDDGGGTALYAGTHYLTGGGLVKWDGSSWTDIGAGVTGGGGASVDALAVFDDGGGPALYLAGNFLIAGGLTANYVAKWDGTSWSSLGSGLDGKVGQLLVSDDGTGPALYAQGVFTTAGGTLANGIAQWDGASWSALGGGTDSVAAMTVFDDGTGPALYAFGSFGFSTVTTIGKWDGTAWLDVGTGLCSSVGVLSTFDDGTGPALYAAGTFSSIGGVQALRIAKWDGTSWAPIGSGLSEIYPLELAVFDDGAGPALYVGGSFYSALDSGDSFLAKWGCPSPIASLPGCYANPATLSAPPSTAKVGTTFTVDLDADAPTGGTAFLFAGIDGTDASGCGLLLPGFGELLLAAAPAPIVMAQTSTSTGSATFAVAIPASPPLVGLTAVFQAVHAAAPPAVLVQPSTGLAVTFSG